MNRSDRIKKRKWSLYIIILIFALIICLGTWNQIATKKNHSVSTGGPSNGDNQLITIELPNGNVMTTNEENIYYEGDKMYYKSKFKTIDITGGVIIEDKDK